MKRDNEGTQKVTKYAPRTMMLAYLKIRPHAMSTHISSIHPPRPSPLSPIFLFSSLSSLFLSHSRENGERA